MKATIITIGDEILLGDTVDTNAAWIGIELTTFGCTIASQLTVGDDAGDIYKALNRAKEDADIVIITGGLGPTSDDKTKECLTEYFNTSLEKDQSLYDKLASYYSSRGRSLNEITDKMVHVPKTAEILPNNYGVAPGMWFIDDETNFIALPGIPYEMKGLMTDEVLPRLAERYTTETILNHYFQTAGKGETVLANRISFIEKNLPDHIKIAYLPSFSRVSIRLTAKGLDKEQLQKEIDDIASQIKPHLSDVLFSETRGDTIVHAIRELSIQKPFKIGLAESCTGGNIMHQITSLSGSSSFFEGGFVSYSNEMKMNELGVKSATLTQYGAVSEQTVTEMVKGTLNKLSCDYGLAVSGIAGPTGGSEDKPVGTVCIAVGDKNEIIARTFTFAKNREKNIRLATMVGLKLLYQWIKEHHFSIKIESN